MTLTLNYVSFIVSDMARALDFYRLLGLPIPAEADAAEDHVEIEVGGLRVAWETETLTRQLHADWTPPQQAGRIGVGIGVDSPQSLDAMVARLRGGGYSVPDPFDAFWGQRYVSVTDPDGTGVDLFAWLPKGEAAS